MLFRQFEVYSRKQKKCLGKNVFKKIIRLKKIPMCPQKYFKKKVKKKFNKIYQSVHNLWRILWQVLGTKLLLDF